MAVQGITYTIGIEMMLASDIVVASRLSILSTRTQARACGFGGAHALRTRAGWGNAMYHLLRADEFDAMRAKDLGLSKKLYRLDIKCQGLGDCRRNVRILSTGIKEIKEQR